MVRARQKKSRKVDENNERSLSDKRAAQGLIQDELEPEQVGDTESGSQHAEIYRELSRPIQAH